VEERGAEGARVAFDHFYDEAEADVTEGDAVDSLAADFAEFSIAFKRYLYLDPVFLMVVNKRDGLIVLVDAIHAHAHLTIRGRRLQDIDVVDRLPIAVVHLEALPVRREARHKTQFIHFKSEPQE
jgi:hypothetical protein